MYCTDCGNKMRQLAFLMSNPWHCDGCERGGEVIGETQEWYFLFLPKEGYKVNDRVYRLPWARGTVHSDLADVPRFEEDGYVVGRLASPVPVERMSGVLGWVDAYEVDLEVVE